MHVSRSLARTLRRRGFRVTIDAAFDEVVAGCADREDNETWITPAIRNAYADLHRLGWAHSVEVWADGALAGGLYGVSIGALFAAESMFHRVSDASKVASLRWRRRLAPAISRRVDFIGGRAEFPGEAVVSPVE